MSGHYKLDGHKTVFVHDFVEWSIWFETADRVVRRDHIGDIEVIEVSTVFLGLDYAYPSDREVQPLLFETMIFGGPLDEECRRYETWDEAEAGHLEMLAEVQTSMSA